MRRALLKKPSLLNSEKLNGIVGDLVGVFFDWTCCKRFGQGIEAPEWGNYDFWIFPSDYSDMPRRVKGGKRLGKGFGKTRCS